MIPACVAAAHREHLLQGFRNQMGKYGRAEVEQAQRQRRHGLHAPPLIFKHRARAARHKGAGRNGRARREPVTNVHSRAADADAIVQQPVAQHYFERCDAKHARELVTSCFERDAAAGCSE